VIQSLLNTGRLDFVFIRPSFFLALFICLPLTFYILDLYYPYKYFKPGLTLFEVMLGIFWCGLILAAISYADKTFTMSRSIFISLLATIAPLVFAIRMFYDLLFRSRFLDKKAMIVGSGALACEMIAVIRKTAHAGLRLVGVVSDDRLLPAGHQVAGLPVLGVLDDLPAVVAGHGPQVVILALEAGRDAADFKVVAEVLKRHDNVTSALHLLERLTGKLPDPLLEGHFVLGLAAQLRSKPYLKLKRILDVLIAFLLIVILMPVWLLAIALLALSDPREIFFVQERIGRNSAPFRLVKLRSMTAAKDGPQSVTKLGRWLRRYRIDEIPQLLNVLKGDMSLVGPRPEIPFFVDRCMDKIPFYETIFTVRPGLTGWAQVKFRYTTTVKDYHEKFAYNLFYLKNISLVLDLLILLRTVKIILFGLGQ